MLNIRRRMMMSNNKPYMTFSVSIPANTSKTVKLSFSDRYNPFIYINWGDGTYNVGNKMIERARHD